MDIFIGEQMRCGMRGADCQEQRPRHSGSSKVYPIACDDEKEAESFFILRHEQVRPRTSISLTFKSTRVFSYGPELHRKYCQRKEPQKDRNTQVWNRTSTSVNTSTLQPRRPATPSQGWSRRSEGDTQMGARYDSVIPLDHLGFFDEQRRQYDLYNRADEVARE